MSIVGELMVIVGANTTALSTSLTKASAELKTFEGTATSHLGSLKVAGAVVAIAATAYLTEAVTSAIKFQDALTDVGVTAHLTAPMAAEMGTAIAEAALGTTASATEMVKALAPVSGELDRISAGHLTAAGSVEVLKAAEELAVSSNSDLTTSMKSISDLLLTYHLGIYGAGDAATLLYAAHAQLGVGVDTLSSQLQKLQPRIAGSGIDLQAMLGITREMQPVVGTGQRAIMTLGSVLQNFVAPSAGAAKQLAAMHIQLVDGQGKFIGFGAAIDLMNAKLAHLSPIQRAAEVHAIFGKNALIATELLRNGSAGLTANIKAITDQGTAAEAATLRNADMEHQFKVLRASIETMTTTIGTALLPVLTQVVNQVMPIVNAVAQWITQNPQLAAQILIVAAAVGTLAMVMGPIVIGIAAAFSPIGLIFIAIGAAIALVITHMDEVKRGIAVVQAAVTGFAAGLAANFQRGVQAVVQFAADVSINFQMGVLSIQTTINGVISWFVGLPGMMFAAATKLGKAIVDGIVAGLGNVAKTVGDILNGIPGLSIAGGIAGGVIGGVNAVAGAGANAIVGHAAGVWDVPTDHLAYVHAGEMIIPAAAASQARTAATTPSRGGSAQPVQLQHTTVLQIDGQTIGQVVERLLFNAGSAASSGFADSPVTS